ncbi:MAG: hypothetical protein ABF780_01090 [Bifidobacterium aquikefiri]|jgi:hypothetical protein|uniref:hypothetical protein n=1 Tax=Bifidobacterium TaxID=1678 RepID=UPI002F35F0BF
MATGKLSFDSMLKQQVMRLLPYLDQLNQQQVKYVGRNNLLEHSGLNDNELQKLIHDGNLPRHTMKIMGTKAYDTESTLKMLARYCGQYGYLVD